MRHFLKTQCFLGYVGLLFNYRFHRMISKYNVDYKWLHFHIKKWFQWLHWLQVDFMVITLCEWYHDFKYKFPRFPLSWKNSHKCTIKTSLQNIASPITLTISSKIPRSLYEKKKKKQIKDNTKEKRACLQALAAASAKNRNPRLWVTVDKAISI